MLPDSISTKTQTGGGHYHKIAQKLPRALKSTRCGILSRLILKTSRQDASIFAKTPLVRGVRSCNMSFFRRDCEKINGFSEDFVGWGRENSEFVARFLFSGGALARLKFGAIAYHLYHREGEKCGEVFEKNHALYLRTIAQKSRWCDNGLVKSAAPLTTTP